MWQVALLLIKYRITLNYFAGAKLVLQHLRAALCRKYLSFTQADHLSWTTLRNEFRVAIQGTAEEVTDGWWKVAPPDRALGVCDGCC